MDNAPPSPNLHILCFIINNMLLQCIVGNSLSVTGFMVYEHDWSQALRRV